MVGRENGGNYRRLYTCVKGGGCQLSIQPLRGVGPEERGAGGGKINREKGCYRKSGGVGCDQDGKSIDFTRRGDRRNPVFGGGNGDSKTGGRLWRKVTWLPTGKRSRLFGEVGGLNMKL